MAKNYKTKDELQEEADELNIDYKQNDTKADLKEMIAEAKMEQEEEKEEKTKKEEKKSESKAAKGEGIYYWLKVPTYKNEKEVLPRGLYHFDKPVKRLERSSKQYVEKFEDSVPQSKLIDIARKLRVKVEKNNGDFREADDLLEELLSN